MFNEKDPSLEGVIRVDEGSGGLLWLQMCCEKAERQCMLHPLKGTFSRRELLSCMTLRCAFSPSPWLR